MSVVRCLLLACAVALAACSSPEDKAAAHVERARELMAAGEYAQAKLEAKSAAQILPKNAAAQLLLAKLAWRDGDYSAAFPHLQMAVESEPGLIEARLRLGDLYLAAGDIKSAQGELDAAARLAPDSAGTHLLAGRLLIAQNENAAGEAEIDAALAADPTLVDAINIKASLLSGRGDNAAALAVLERGIEGTKGADQQVMRDSRLKFFRATGQKEAYEAGLEAMIREARDPLPYRYQLLDFYTAEQRSDDQERMLRELVALDPENHAITVRLANFLVGHADAAGAERLLKDSVAKHPDNADLQIALGDYYRFLKRSPEALAAYQAAAAKWPVATDAGQLARNRVAAQHAVDGDMKQARADIDAILEAVPDNPDALLTRAMFLFLDRKYEDAIADLRTVLRRQKSAEALLLLARSYVGVGDTVVAKDTYRRLLGDYPGNAEGAKELAVLLSDQGDAAAAADILRQFVAVRPDDAEASAALVQNLLAQRDLAAAEAEAQRMVARGAGGVSADQQFGAVLQARGASEEALARYKAVLDKDPNQVEALAALVQILLDTQRADEAITYLERYPKGDVAASLLLGKAYSHQGDVAAARTVIGQAIVAQPADGRPYLALAALAPPDSPQQLADLERGWKAARSDTALGLFLGSAYERKGRVEDAIAVYEEIVRQDRASPAVINNLAALLLDHRNDKESLARALELARRLGDATDAIALDTLGWAYYRNDDIANAVRQLERAVASDGRLAIAQYHLGMAYAASGNSVSARQHLAQAVELGGGEQALVANARAALAKLPE